MLPSVLRPQMTFCAVPSRSHQLIPPQPSGTVTNLIPSLSLLYQTAVVRSTRLPQRPNGPEVLRTNHRYGIIVSFHVRLRGLPVDVVVWKVSFFRCGTDNNTVSPASSWLPRDTFTRPSPWKIVHELLIFFGRLLYAD